MIKSKRTVMGFAAILIIIFHFYIPIFQNVYVGKTLSGVCYIGVDLFFLMSGISLSKYRSGSYWSFVWDRVKAVYFPYVLFSVLAFLVNTWSIEKLFVTISGVSLFTKGGAAFCWFFPGIMLFYLLAPLLIKVKEKYFFKGFIAELIIWCGTVMILQHVFFYTKIFILLLRFPVFLIGIYLNELREKMNVKSWRIFIAAGLTVGTVLFFTYALLIKKNPLLDDAQYIFAIPMVLAMASVVDCISSKIEPGHRPIAWIGGFTLEIYAIQMIFGYKIIKVIAGIIGTNNLAFLLSAVIIVLIAFTFFRLKKTVVKLIIKKN